MPGNSKNRGGRIIVEEASKLNSLTKGTALAQFLEQASGENSWQAGLREQEAALSVAACQQECNEQNMQKRLQMYKTLEQHNIMKTKKHIPTEDKLCRDLFKWCIAHAVHDEADFFAHCDEDVPQMMLEQFFAKSLERALRASYQFFVREQKDAWTWLCKIGRGTTRYLPAVSFDKTYSYQKNTGKKWEELLLLQEICPRSFHSALKAWLQQTDFKKNCLFLWGDVSTGKTMFANAIRGLFAHRQMANSTSSSNFSFGNCLNTRIIIYEEPFLHPTLLEDMKSVFGGAELTVDAKYSMQQPMRRTPLLVTSNVLKLARGHASEQSELALQARSYIFHFSQNISEFVHNKIFLPCDLANFIYKYDINSACACATCGANSVFV